MIVLAGRLIACYAVWQQLRQIRRDRRSWKEVREAIAAFRVDDWIAVYTVKATPQCGYVEWDLA